VFQKDYRDAALNYKVQLAQGQAVHSFSMMQSINSNSSFGYQMSYMGMVGECNFGYAGLHTIGAKKEH